MNELLERLEIQSEYPKTGLYSHKVCVIRQDDLLEVIKILKEINKQNN